MKRLWELLLKFQLTLKHNISYFKGVFINEHPFLFSMKYLLICVSLLFSTVSFSQRERTDYPLILNNDTLDHAWAGGFNAPQFSKIDLNFDGVKDLYVFERGWDATIKTFVWNDGAYEFAPEYADQLPFTRNWAILKDYNCDGKNDMFTWSEFGGGLSIYKNTSHNEILSFERVETLLFTESVNGPINVFMNGVDIPAIVDLDGDGDLDILAFSIGGVNVEMQENLSMDLYGVCDSLEFQVGDACWGKFAENGLTNELNLNESCEDLSPSQGARHGGSTLMALDDDGDGDMDLAIGDVSYSNLVFARNGGDNNLSLIDSSRSDYPMESKALDITVFPAAYNIDVDNDGFKDILVSPNLSGFSIDKRNVWYYQNISNSNDPNFEFVQNDFLVGEMLDVGYQSQPIVIDVDVDGLKDVLVFNESEFVNEEMISNITFLKNIGSTSDPVFDIVDTNYMDFRSFALVGAHASFGDLDNDGDLDMIVSDQPGGVYYFENTAGSDSPLNLELVNADYFELDLQGYGTPFLCDINSDSLLDIVSGDKRGELSYYENLGNVSSAHFVDSLKISLFGGVDVSEFCCGGYSSPFIKKNNDSLLLYVGGEESIMYTYLIDTDDLNGDFELLDSVNYGSVRLKPCIDDLDNDGQWDLLMGEIYGGIQMYEISGMNISVNQLEYQSFRVYPNPTQTILNLEKTFEKVHVFNILGKEVLLLSEVNRIEVSGLSSGVYTVKATKNEVNFLSRFIKF